VLEEHRQIFQSVATIYKHAMAHHGLVSPNPIILAKDKTKVKSRICWEHHLDCLTGFYKPKENHMCIPTYKVLVREGESRYNNILGAFGNDKVGGFAWVIMVCPLHEKLPRPVLFVTCTCGCFDSSWAREQWDRIDEL
jgi:hypothetical protein